MYETKASLRVKEDIERYAHNPIKIATRAPAVRANPNKEVKTVAHTAKQRAASRRNIKKAQAARRKNKRGGRRRKVTRKKASRRRTTRRSNAWSNDKAGHRRAAKKGVRRKKRKLAKRRKTARRTRRRRNPASAPASQPSARSSNRSNTTRTRTTTSGVKVVKVPGATKIVRVAGATRQKNPRKRRRSRRRRNPATDSVVSSGSFDGLFSNPMGPFSAASLRGYGVAVGGIGLGLTGARFLDRFIATMKPADSKGGKKGQHPWYGRDAAAAQRRRPDAYRLGAQAGGAVVSMAITYWTRRGKILPWLMGGMAVGFGANLFNMLLDWYVMPMILPVKADDEATLANRLYPMEQTKVQDAVDAIFENWEETPALSAGQDKEPLVQSVLTGPGGVYTLGKAGNGKSEPGKLADQGPAFFQTGTLGRCASCGGDGGCYGNCEAYSGMVTVDCGIHEAQKASYTVQPNDNFDQMINEANVDVGIVNNMNGGGSSDSYWSAGNEVVVPYAFGKYLEHKGTAPPAATAIPATAAASAMPPVSAASFTAMSLSDNPEQEKEVSPPVEEAPSATPPPVDMITETAEQRVASLFNND